MSVPPHPQPDAAPADAAPAASSAGPNLMRSALWVAIGALILAAIVCVVWVLIGPENGIIGRAFLTILLLAGFAGVAILDAHLAPGRPSWLILASMVVWIVILLDGAFLIWMPIDDYYFGGGMARFVSFVLVVGVLQLALLHVRLYAKAYARYVTGFTTALFWTTIALLTTLAVLLVLALTFHEFIDFGELYWRIVVAITILAAVGTALIPLVNALFAPKKPRPTPGYAGAYPGAVPPVSPPNAPEAAYPGTVPGAAYPGAAYPGSVYPEAAYPGSVPGAAFASPAGPSPAGATGAAPWPTYADGVTPLPVLPDGSPDWNAYYTGTPTYPAQTWPPPAAAQPAAPPPGAGQAPPAQPGYQGYPPAPPAPR